jgi:hypothetical protein
VVIHEPHEGTARAEKRKNLLFVEEMTDFGGAIHVHRNTSFAFYTHGGEHLIVSR